MGQVPVQPGGPDSLVPFAHTAHHGGAEAPPGRAARPSWRCCLGSLRREAAPAGRTCTGRPALGIVEDSNVTAMRRERCSNT